MESIPTCRGIVKQGPRKGQQCIPATTVDSDGYCTKHQRDKEYDKLVAEGKKVCRFFLRGCNAIVTPTSLTCQSCIEKHRTKTTACKHQGCKFSVEENGGEYCGKHQRDRYRDYELQHNVKVCSIERGCFNICESGHKSCLQCIINDHIENNRYFERDIQNDSKCIDCLAEYDSAYPHSNILKRCQSCCEVVIEGNKDRSEITRCLNKTTSIHSAYNMCIKGAADRNYAFTLPLKRFAEIVVQKCFYCGMIDRINGIDRIDNSKHYVDDNVVACCTTCNRMKHTMTVSEFVNKCSAIAYYTRTGESKAFQLVTSFPSFVTVKSFSYKVYIKMVEKRNIVFELNSDEYDEIKKLPCYLCGMPTSPMHQNGIDRVNNHVGYLKSNCKPCCGRCNASKADIPIGIFYQKCFAIDANEALAPYKIVNGANLTEQTLPHTPLPADSTDTHVAEAVQERFTINQLVVLFNKDIQTAIEYCKVHGKDDVFISKLMGIYEKREEDENVSNKIKSLVHANTKQHSDQKNHERKHLKAKEVLALFETQKVDEYLQIHEELFGTPSHHLLSDIQSFTEDMGSLAYDERVERCRKIIERERLRRNYAETAKRKKEIKDVVKPTNVIQHVPAEEMVIAEKPRMEICESICASPPPSPATSSVPDLVIPKQWKVQQVYDFVRTGNAHYYKAYCEESNDLKGPDWESDWNGFVLGISDLSFDDAEPLIRTFIESLRTKRHNKLCVDKRNVLEREDRQIWPAETIARAFIDGKIARFKEFTEQSTGDDPTDVKWQKRWAGFVKQLEENKTSVSLMLPYISKFLTAQRTKRYKRNKEGLLATHA